jgi:sugar lactone lactonase YvrE
MKQFSVVFAMLAAATLGGCKKKAAENKEPEVGSGSAVEAAPADAAPAAWDGKSPLSLTEGVSTPESVLYDADSDFYLVSNINGDPLGADDNGYIMRISPDGKITDPKWIDGAKDNIKLNAPKGMAIVNGVLYVADIDTVHQFDSKTGEPKGDIKIDGATFLNDVTPMGDGVAVTDSGLDAKFGPTGTDAVWVIGKDGKAKSLIKNKSLANPNGIVAGEKGAVWVVTFGSGEIYSVDAKGKQAKGQKLPKGQLDGIVLLDGGDALVSSWEGSAVYRGKPGGDWKAVVENVKSPADIGYDAKRHRLLIPIFQGNTVIIQPMDEGMAAGAGSDAGSAAAGSAGSAAAGSAGAAMGGAGSAAK